MFLVTKVSSGMTMSQAHKLFTREFGVQVSPKSAYSWVKKARAGTLLNAHPGRPPLVSDERLVKQLDASLVTTRSSPTKAVFASIFEQCAYEKWTERGGSRAQWRLQSPHHFARTTLANYRKRAKITKAQASQIPTKRDEHRRSIRDAVSETLVYYSLLHFYSQEWTVFPIQCCIQSLDPVSVPLNCLQDLTVFRTPLSKKLKFKPSVISNKKKRLQH